MGIRLQPAQIQSSGDGGNSGHSLGHPHDALSMEREIIRGRIIHLLRQRQQQPINDVLLNKFRDIARRLEEGLFKTARTKEEYMNLGTLEQRLSILVQRFQRQRQMTAANSSMPPTTVNTGSQLPTGGVNGGCFSRPDGDI